MSELVRDERRAPDSHLSGGRSAASVPRAAVQASDSYPRGADGKPSDSALTAYGKTADGNLMKSRQKSSNSAEKIKLTVRLNYETVMELKLFCALKKKLLAEVVETAVSDFCSRQSARDMMIDDDALWNQSSTKREHHHRIQRIYERLTGNNWRRSDDEALKRLPRDLPLEVIEMAMLMAALRARTAVRSFAYFVPEILTPDYAVVKAPDQYLRYLWRKFEALKQATTKEPEP